MPRTSSKASADRAHSSKPTPESRDIPRRDFLRLASLAALAVTGGVEHVYHGPVGRNHLRPPGAVRERDFLATCIRCGRCAEVCPYRSIRILGPGKGLHVGTPLIDAEKIPCYLCMKCVEVCPSGALKPVPAEEAGMGLAHIIEDTCWAYNGTALCRACYDICPLKDRAIKLERLKPIIVEEACVGCGACVKACPVTPERAIYVDPPKP